MSNALDRILIDAAEIGAINVVKAAIQDGADVDTVSNSETPLSMAVYNQHSDIVKILIDNGAKVGNPKLLLAAAARKNIETLRILLDAGMDVNARDTDHYGNTVLMVCDDEETVRFLIKNSVDVNATRPLDGFTALMLAVTNSNLALVRLLVENGADMFIRDQKERDALGLAATLESRNPEIIRFLVDEMCGVEADEVPF